MCPCNKTICSYQYTQCAQINIFNILNKLISIYSIYYKQYTQYTENNNILRPKTMLRKKKARSEWKRTWWERFPRFEHIAINSKTFLDNKWLRLSLKHHGATSN